MKFALITSIAMLVLAVAPASARPPSGAVEDTRELEPRMIALPSNINGTVNVQGCTACVRTSYTMRGDVQFFAANVEVSFVEFKHYLSTHPESAVLLVAALKQNVITRFHAQ